KHLKSSGRLSYDRDGTTSLLDFFPGALREPMRRNFQGFRHFAVTKHDDVMFCFLDNAAMVQHFRSDLIVRGEGLLQSFEAYLNPLLLENISEAALRQT